jgi:O-antigen ligase
MKASQRQPAGALPREPAADGWAAGLLCAIMLVAPAVGSPSEELLQDTLKSAIVALGALGAALLFLRAQRHRTEPLRWHAVLVLPLLLMAYALGSMAWSHAYLAGVEAVRWFVFAVILWVALNTFSRERLPALAWCVHGGAVIASLWAALQFWSEFSPFPQGAPPASSFINRNFFAEFAVCALPFGMLLLARARQGATIALLAFSVGLVVVALQMTGTRSALVALWLQALVVLPLVAWRCRGQLPWTAWPRRLQLLAAGVLAATVLGLGLVPSGNPQLLAERQGAAPLLRGLQRAQSIDLDDATLNLRFLMWRDTLRAIRAHPLAGLGAGAWENEIPRYQAEGEQLETDYYAHNEVLQLLAEYGLVGWLFLLLLCAYLLHAAWRGWRDAGPEADAERPWRAVLLCSLLALLMVSNAGFPWRLAVTGALFALCLGALAASDARLGFRPRGLAMPLRWSPRIAHGAIAATVACLALAAYLTQRAAESERKLVSAARLALSLSATGEPLAPQFLQARREVTRLARDGIALNPHYRKITPAIADELGRWGDWANATWIWESVLASRPNVVAILCNAARGHASLGDSDQALVLLERARRLQPRAPAVRALEVVLLARAGQPEAAMRKAQESLDAGIVDQGLLNTYLALAWGARDHRLALQLLERRMARWPETRARGLLQQGLIQADGLHQPERALESFRKALAAAAPAERAALLQQVPEPFRGRLAAEAAQTSANSR